ncbi:MAG: M14 family zinc carboxypeptidase [candidate division KSB1 bacterium]
MKTFTSLLAAFICLCTATALLAQAPEYQAAPRQMLRIDALDQATLQKFLALDLDVAEIDPQQNAFEIIATPADRERLVSLGVRYATLNDNLETFALALRAQGYLDHFHDYAETLTELQLAEALHPSLVQLVDIGDSWEKTQGLADRDIWAVKISDNVQAEENEAEVLIIGNHHAREIITPETVLDFMNYLLQNYGGDPYVTHLVNHRQIWLVPILNPDGLDHVHQNDLWWRKNRRRNANGTFGVDLNRNYAFKWGYDNIGSSPSGGSSTYRGAAPFSEPETAALRDFVNAHRFRASLSYHSYGNLLIYPWGYIAQHTPEHASFVALADSMVTYHGYKAGLGVETVFYTTNGDSDDWLYGEQTTKNKIFAMTPEVGNAFHPDTTEIEQLILENRGPNLFLTYAVGEEPVVAHAPLADTIKTIGPYRIAAQVSAPIILTQAAALASEGVLLHYNSTGTPPFQSVVMTATSNAQEFAAAIPAVSGNQRVYYFISAMDDRDRIGHAPRAASAGAYFSFYVRGDFAPRIVVAPEQLRWALLPDITFTDTLIVANRGQLDLKFNLRDSAFTDWLKFGLDTARVQTGRELAVPLMINTTRLQAGTHSALLLVHANDPAQPITRVPVELTIGSTSVEGEAPNSLPKKFALHQSRPNPFRGATMIPYELPANVSGEIKLAIYNLIGQQVRVLVQREQRAGYYSARWEGKDDLGRIVPAGIYFYRLEGQGFVQVKKMVLAR